MFFETFVFIIMCVVAIGGAVYWYQNKNIFRVPSCDINVDVTGKRKVDSCEEIERKLMTMNKDFFVNYNDAVQKEYAERVEKYKNNKRRLMQLEEAYGNKQIFAFIVVREQTRYKQCNYVRYPYKVTTIDDEVRLSLDEIMLVYKNLERMHGLTSSEYHAANQRKLMTPELRQQIAERDNYTCQICGKYMPDKVGLQIDHIIPVAKGGKSIPSNLQVLCSVCNGKKSDKM